MQVRVGDTVKMRDGRIVSVTDAAEPGPYETIDRTAYYEQDKEVVTSSMPGETIFMGTDADGYPVVSDMSEVVSILF